MKRTDTDKKLEALGFKLITFTQAEHLVEYINELTGQEIRFNLLSKSVRFKKHLHGSDGEFECDKILLDLISTKMLELL
jgi:hypothetical protein